MTPAAVIRVVEEAFRITPPNRHTSLLRAVERAFWGSRAHPAVAQAHCPLCGTTGDAGEALVAQLGHHCDRCLRVCYGTVVELRVGQAPPPWEMALAETARALRTSGVDQGDEALAALESRIFGRDPLSPPCARCGPLGAWPRADAKDDRCGVCRRTREEAGIVVAGPATGLCDRCVDAGHRFLLRPR